MTDYEKIVLSYLPSRLKKAAESFIGKNTVISELRLRSNKKMTLTCRGNNIDSGIVCTREEIDFILEKLCRNSFYAHTDEIKEGFISTAEGIRAGVVGKAVTENGNLTLVRDITSINIRIPHRVESAGNNILPLAEKYGSILVYSPPAGGKTTVLREIIPRLSEKFRVAVVDTRYELTTGIEDSCMTDILLGYPRSIGITIAVRTMSPEYLICDEIATQSDAESVIFAHSAGVNVIATAHAGGLDELYKNRAASALIEGNIFRCVCGLKDFDNLVVDEIFSSEREKLNVH